MAQYKKCLISLVICASLAVVIADDDDVNRQGRTLVNTFPFNQPEHGVGHHARHDNHGNHGHHQADPREQRQFGRNQGFSGNSGSGGGRFSSGGGGGSESSGLDIGTIAAAGQKCIDKVIMVDETKYDDHIECHHSYSRRCHETYVTDFEPAQEEECVENYKKNCWIEYKKVASTEQVQKCHTPFICDQPGPDECKTVYTTVCSTVLKEHAVTDDVVNCRTEYEEQCRDVTRGYTTDQECERIPRQVCDKSSAQVTKHSPQTTCKKVPNEACGPSKCIPRPGQEKCWPENEVVVSDVPKETCNLEPQAYCKPVTKLIPKLKPTQECVDVPKEVCTRSRKNPRTIKVPIVKKWCYRPSAESGL